MTTSMTKTLEALRQDEVKERQRAREHELEASAAKRKAEEARSNLVEGHVAGDARAIRAAEKARGEAVDRADNAGIGAEGAQIRADRSGRERQAFEAENARALIEELSPAAGEVAARLERAARELIAADQEWSAISQRVSELVVAVPNASPIADAPGSHALAGIAHDLRRALAEGEVESPAPHFRELSRREAA